MSEPSANDGRGPRLRLMTSNLMNGRGEPSAIADLIAEQDVDIACFQELAPLQAEAISRVLPHGKLDPRTDHEGLGIALRRPGQVERLPIPSRDGRVVRLAPAEWPELDATLEVLDIHIQAPHARPPPWKNLTTRRVQMAALLAYLESVPARHRVVAGDFNATPLWPVYRRMAERLCDAPRAFALARGQRPAASWGPLMLDGIRLLRIDHVFTEGVDASRVELHRVRGTDHAALIVDLELA